MRDKVGNILTNGYLVVQGGYDNPDPEITWVDGPIAALTGEFVLRANPNCFSLHSGIVRIGPYQADVLLYDGPADMFYIERRKV